MKSLNFSKMFIKINNKNIQKDNEEAIGRERVKERIYNLNC